MKIEKIKLDQSKDTGIQDNDMKFISLYFADCQIKNHFWELITRTGAFLHLASEI